MNSEHPEYNRDTNPYPSFGKKYSSERAIISLTSWKARINTVSKTIYSLLKQCPGFHIVLVLSEEEFPKMMDELPENLTIFVENELIEILWVYKNYKSFKKLIFTADKYNDVPIISADDGCIYIRNYAEELYQEWIKHPNDIISEVKFVYYDISFGGGGCGMLFPPKCLFNAYKLLNDDIVKSLHDDAFYGCLAKAIGIVFYFINTEINKPKNLPFKDFDNANNTSVWKNRCSNNIITYFKQLFHIH